MAGSGEVCGELICWFETYLKNRDIMLRKIKSIEKTDKGLNVTYKDKKQAYFMVLEPEEIDFSLIEKAENPTLVMLNTDNNLKLVIKSWPSLIKYRTLSIFFVNPYSELDKRWILYPHTHHQIGDGQSLKMGLASMFASVEPTTLETFTQKNAGAKRDGAVSS